MLEQIADRVRDQLKSRSRRAWRAEIEAQLLDAPPVRDFRAALAGPDPDFILEIKRRSPSGNGTPLDLDVTEIGKLYQQEGASCVSVLTEPEFFSGSLDDLRIVRKATQLPLMRKDFTIDELQIAEARAAGADAILLIVALLSPQQLAEFLHYSREIDMATLVEIHSETELEHALDAGADMIGVNNRDLTTLETDLATGEQLLPLIPGSCVRVAESGIGSRENVLHLRLAGADAFLIGSAVMRAQNRQMKIRELLGHDED